MHPRIRRKEVHAPLKSTVLFSTPFPGRKKNNVGRYINQQCSQKITWQSWLLYRCIIQWHIRWSDNFVSIDLWIWPISSSPTTIESFSKSLDKIKSSHKRHSYSRLNLRLIFKGCWRKSYSTKLSFYKLNFPGFGADFKKILQAFRLRRQKRVKIILSFLVNIYTQSWIIWFWHISSLCVLKTPHFWNNPKYTYRGWDISGWTIMII